MTATFSHKPVPSGEKLEFASVKVLTPCVPGKMICLWNNFAANAKKQNLSKPPEPLWFLKASNAFLAQGEAIKRPPSYAGKIVYEGELGIVIGKQCSNVSEEEAEACIFGYTCVNDVTAIDLLNKDPTFAQWVRSKSFDTFGAFGPVIATGLDPMTLSVRTILNGAERQNYPVSDMFYPPVKLVSLLSKDVTLMPGDVIACGTSVGVGVMTDAGEHYRNFHRRHRHVVEPLQSGAAERVPARRTQADPHLRGRRRRHRRPDGGKAGSRGQ